MYSRRRRTTDIRRPVLKQRIERRLFFEFTSHTVVFAAVFAAVAVAFSQLVPREGAAKQTAAGEVLPRIVIDPGHGGEDGGAVAPDGTAEKDINLSVAKSTCAMLTALGCDCVMTREDDVMLSGDGAGSKKLRDLQNRVAFTDGGGCVFVSIHQNKFPQNSCAGTQVYYSKNDARSEKLASVIRNNTQKYLQKNNTRQIKRAGSEIYVLDRCTVPAVLVECGFLSNPAELELLKTEEYQKKLGCVIALSVADYLYDDAAGRD